jgi:Mg/Co/Ni transporter MgtE
MTRVVGSSMIITAITDSGGFFVFLDLAPRSFVYKNLLKS